MIERELQHRPGDPALFNALLLDVVQSVDASIDSDEFLSTTLKRIRDFFVFGNAFIYEQEPDQSFVLREHSEVFAHDTLCRSFMVSDMLTDEQIKYIKANPFCCTEQGERNNEYQEAICRHFGAQSTFAVFIIDDEDRIVGSVGMADKRQHIALSPDELFQATTLFKLILERSRSRINKRKLEYTSRTLENIMDHLGFDIYVNDFYTHDMLYANESMAAPYGGWENMRGKKCYEALYDGVPEECTFCPKQNLIDEEGNPTKVYVWDYQRPFDKRWFRVICAAFTWTDGRLAQVISSTDINEAKNNELLIQRMAFFDMLTGIPNRRKFEQDFRSLMETTDPEGGGVSILFLDLDGFKEINDTYGHNGGDTLLRHISKLFDENDITAGHCYRYGGDEFIFLYDDMSAADALARGAEIVELLKAPVEIEGAEVWCTGSVGLSHFPEDGADFWDLLDKADNVMYRNKQEKKAGTITYRGNPA